MRITDKMRFNTNVSNLFNIQSQYNDMMEKIATQKKVNRASDDPIAAAKIVDIRQGIAANEQYRKNIADSDNWVSITESTLSSAYKLLTKARGIALGEAEGTANAESRKIAAQNIQSFIDEMASLANEKIGDRYLFSGSKNSATPFSTTPGEARIEAAEPAGNNVFSGAALSLTAYSGPAKTVTVKITNGGSLDTATAQISTDGGATWNGTDLPMAGSEIDLGDGISLELGTGNFVADDTFVVVATTGNVVVTPDIGNTSTGTAAASVAYSGAANKTYAVKITGNRDPLGMTIPGVSTAQISADGGRTWELTTISAGGDINLGGNVKLTIGNASTETFGENDIFVVNATAGGYYRGNNDQLSMTINRGTSIAYNITGAGAFTASEGGVDVFRTLNDLRNALENNDTDGISGQLENLKNAQEQVLLNQSLCGTKANHLEMAKNSLTHLDEKLTSLLSAAQDADLAELATRLSMQEIALQASYAMAAKISDTTILKFLT
jgi:flagellar hook-associated protein 3 FlgL